MNHQFDYDSLPTETQAFDLTLLIDTLQETVNAQGFTAARDDYLMLLEVVGTALEQVNWDTVRETLKRRAEAISDGD